MKMSAEQKFERDELKKLGRIEKENQREKLLASLVDRACDKGELLARDYRRVFNAHAELRDKLRALVKEFERREELQANRGNDFWRENCDNQQAFSEGASNAYRNCARELSALIEGAK